MKLPVTPDHPLPATAGSGEVSHPRFLTPVSLDTMTNKTDKILISKDWLKKLVELVDLIYNEPRGKETEYRISHLLGFVHSLDLFLEDGKEVKV